jgi:hypothetical protein
MEITRSDVTVEEVAKLGNMRPHPVRRGLKEGQIEGTRLGSPPGDSVHEDDGQRVPKDGLRSQKTPRGRVIDREEEIAPPLAGGGQRQVYQCLERCFATDRWVPVCRHHNVRSPPTRHPRGRTRLYHILVAQAVAAAAGRYLSEAGFVPPARGITGSHGPVSRVPFVSSDRGPSPGYDVLDDGSL